MKRLFTLLALCGALFLSACSTTLDKTGPYAGDQILYTADQATATAYDVLDTFLLWEQRTDQTVVPANVHAAAEKFRREAPAWFQSAIALRTAYVANPTPENRLKLANALGVLQAALAEATHYMVQAKKIPGVGVAPALNEEPAPAH